MLSRKRNTKSASYIESISLGKRIALKTSDELCLNTRKVTWGNDAHFGFYGVTYL